MEIELTEWSVKCSELLFAGDLDFKAVIIFFIREHGVFPLLRENIVAILLYNVYNTN